MQPATPEDKRDILDKLVAAKLDQAALALKQWYGGRDLRKQFSEHLAEDIDRTDSRELAELFAHHCPVAGASPSDYRNRWQPIPALGWALIGIRFWSLDLDRPFITVVASTELPADQQALTTAALHLSHAYSMFKPKHVRFFLPAHHPLQPSGDQQFWEKRFLAAPINELLQQPLPENYQRVELRQAPETTNYPQYRQAYQELLHSSPEHSEYTRLESEEDLAELAQEGNLFDILVDGTWAGTAAVDTDGEEGLTGYRVVEFLLKGSFRGQRLGTAAQRHLAEKLQRQPEQQVLFGTIDSRNQAPRRTAKRLGRIDIGGYLWTTIDNTTTPGGHT